MTIKSTSANFVGAGLSLPSSEAKQPAQPRQRKTLRLPEYDYASTGAYFVTICVNNRKPILGNIVGEEIRLSKVGKVVKEVWKDLPKHYENIELDEFIVMPNHVHGILWLIDESPQTASVGAGLRPSPTKIINHGLPEIIRAFKSFSAREVNKIRINADKFSWQRGYHDHVIRNDEDLNLHRAYMQSNPLKWTLDEYYL